MKSRCNSVTQVSDYLARRPCISSKVLTFLVSPHPPHLPGSFPFPSSPFSPALSPAFPDALRTLKRTWLGSWGAGEQAGPGPEPPPPAWSWHLPTVCHAEARSLACTGAWPGAGRKSLGVPRVSLPGSWGPAWCQTQSLGDLATGNEEEEEESGKEEGQECYQATPLCRNKQCRVLMTCCCSSQNAQVALSLPQLSSVPSTQAPACAPFLVLF